MHGDPDDDPTLYLLRQSLRTPPDCRRAAQQAWSQRNPDYWRNYRDARPEYAQRNRDQQRSRDQGRNVDLAKMDTCDLYRITRYPALPRENGDSWVVEITPVCVTCPCKVDVSRKDLIDASVVCPYLSKLIDNKAVFRFLSKTPTRCAGRVREHRPDCGAGRQMNAPNR